MTDTERDTRTDAELERRCLCVSCRGGVPDEYLWSVVRVYSGCNGFDDCAGCPLFTRSVSVNAGCRAHYDTALTELTERLADARAELVNFMDMQQGMKDGVVVRIGDLQARLAESRAEVAALLVPFRNAQETVDELMRLRSEVAALRGANATVQYVDGGREPQKMLVYLDQHGLHDGVWNPPADSIYVNGWTLNPPKNGERIHVTIAALTPKEADNA